MRRDAAPTRAHVVASLSLLLLAWIPLAPMLTGKWFPFQHDFFMSDLLHAFLPYHYFLHERLTALQIPQWWPDIFSGAPFWPQIETAVLWPPNTIASYFLQAPASLDAVWLCNTLIGGLSGWYYARSLGARPLVATLAGVAWSLSGGIISHLKHPNMQAAIALMPLMLATLENALNARRSFVWFSLAVAASLFAGMPQVTWLTLLGCAVYALHSWLYEGLREAQHRAKALRQALALSFATALAFVIAAVVLWPTFRMNAHSARQAGLTYEFAHRIVGPPGEILTALLPVGHSPYTNQGSFSWESPYYQGIIVTIFALLGLFWTSSKRRMAWELVMLMCVILSMDWPIARALWNVVPGMNLFRFHHRFFLLLALIVLSLAIDGLENFLQWICQRLPRSSWHVWITLSLLVITVVELSISDRGYLHWEQWRYWTQPGQIAQIIPADGQHGRLYHINEYWRMQRISDEGPSDDPTTYRTLGSVPLGCLGTLHHLRSAGGYTNLVNERVSAYFKQFTPDAMSEFYQPTQWQDGRVTPAWRSMLDRANVGFILTERPVDAASGLEILLDGPTRILRNETMLPRAYVARAWHAVTSNAQAAAYMQGPGAADSRVPTIEGISANGTGDHTPVPVPTEDPVPERVVLDLSRAPTGWLVLTDSNDAGWTATLDGTPVEIHYANGYQRAVRVAATSHRLVFQYRTPGLVEGAVTSAVGLLALILWLLWLLLPRLRRRWRRREV